MNNPNLIQKLARHSKSFSRNTHGGVAVIFAVLSVVIMMFAALAIEMENLNTQRTQLQAAAQAAAVAAMNYIKFNSIQYTQQYTDSNNNTILQTSLTTDANSIATKVFNRNLSSGASGSNLKSLTISFDSNFPPTYVTITYSATVNTLLGSLLGKRSTTITGSDKATYTPSAYINFYVLMDMGESMSYPEITSDQVSLYNTIGCAMACHGTTFTYSSNISGYSSAYAYALYMQFLIRSDAVYAALTTAIQAANVLEGSNNYYNISMKGFGTTSSTTSPASGATLDPTVAIFNKTAVSGSFPASLSGLYPTSTAAGSGSSIYEALTKMKTLFTTYSINGGSGVSGDPYNVLLLITPGVVDSFYTTSSTYNYLKPTLGTNCVTPGTTIESSYSVRTTTSNTVTIPTNCTASANSFQTMSPMNSTWCDSIKNMGITVATLNVVYPTITSALDTNTLIRLGYLKSSGATSLSTSDMPTLIASNMKACASDASLYQAATSPAGYMTGTSDPIYGAVSILINNAIAYANKSNGPILNY